MSTSAPFPCPAALTLGPSTANLLRSFLQDCESPHTRRAYRRALTDLDVFAEGQPLTRPLLLAWREAMSRTTAPATVNLRLAAARLFLKEARRQRHIDADTAAELTDVKGIKQRGQRTGIWLTAPQATQLLAVPDRKHPRGRRNYCILALLLGCALRRAELATLTVEHLQMSDDRWIIRNLRGKGGRIRQVAVPAWVKEAVAAYLYPTGIRSGLLIRQLTGDPVGLSADSIWDIVKQAAAQIGIPDFAPHDLRRTCARLARKNGGELEQIQYLLGHASLVTTERYLGTTQNLQHAVNDTLGFNPGA